MNMITNVAATLKKSLSPNVVSTPEEICARKKKALNIVDVALDQFQQNLQNGKIPLKSSIDFERLIRCLMVLIEESKNISTEESNQSIDKSKIANILDENDPMVKNIFEKLYNGYNKLNDMED